MQGKVGEILRDRGFRAFGRAFNRVTVDGLTQVVDLQMGRFDPPGTVHIPVLRENLYGKFTVNLGVFVPEVHVALLPSNPTPAVIQASSCCVRTRLGSLGAEESDIWWEVRWDEAIVEDLRRRLIRDAIPFFACFETRDGILPEWLHLSKSAYAHNPRIVCAIILVARNQNTEARRLLVEQARETNIPQHAGFVRSLAERLGLGWLETG